MNELYNNNSDFKAYVDKYIIRQGVDLQTALSHAMVRNYADYLTERGAGETKLPNMWGSAGDAHENVAEIYDEALNFAKFDQSSYRPYYIIERTEHFEICGVVDKEENENNKME